jgi:hypothetical protein
MQNSNSSFNSDPSSQKPEEESKSPFIGINSLDSFEEEKNAMISPKGVSRGPLNPHMRRSQSDVPLDKNPQFIKEEDLFEEMSNFDKFSKRSKCSK